METEYRRLIRYLPEGLRGAAAGGYGEDIQELRLRCGRPLSALYPGGERSLGGRAVTAEDVSHLVTACAKGSMYAASDSIKSGFITVEGGHRIGFCGRAVVREGEVVNLRELSSASMRIARQISGAADFWKGLDRQSFQGALIIGPPGSGKTTILRELVRLLSNSGGRVGLVDERGELAACREGLPGFDVGEHTDVLTDCPKGQGLIMLLRAMNPDILAVDEITAPQDADAILSCANCGCKMLATAHGSSVAELEAKPLFRRLLVENVFKVILTLSSPGGAVGMERRYG